MNECTEIVEALEKIHILLGMIIGILTIMIIFKK